MEEIEIKMLDGANKCTTCGVKLDSFMKYTAGSRYIWSGWCNGECQAQMSPIVGNTPVN